MITLVDTVRTLTQNLRLSKVSAVNCNTFAEVLMFLIWEGCAKVKHIKCSSLSSMSPPQKGSSYRQKDFSMYCLNSAQIPILMVTRYNFQRLELRMLVTNNLV